MKLSSTKTELDETNAGVVVRNVLAAYKKQKVDEFVRGQYAIPYDDLLSFGKDKLPPELFREVMVQVRDIQIGAEFIIAGFSRGFPIIFQTDNNGKVLVREGFSVIGEGSYLAHSVLLHRAHMGVNSQAQTLYTVYEAKKYAEGVTSVGSYTWMTVIHSDGRKERMTPAGHTFLESQYVLLGPKTIPSNLALIDGMFTDGERLT